MKPLLGQTKVDKLLSQVSLYYSNESYIAELIMPTLKVKEKTGIVPKFGKESLKVHKDGAIRLPGSRAKSFNYTVDNTDKYSCFEHSLEKQVPWEMQDNQDDPYDAKRDATKIATDQMMVLQEYALAGTMSDATKLTNNVTLSGGAQWNQAGTSNPIGDINTAIDAVRTKIARKPNSLSLSFPVFKTLKTHASFRDAIKYTNGGQLSDNAAVEGLKAYFNLKNVFIGEAVGDLTIEGQTASLTDLWGKNAWLHYTAEKAALFTPSFGYTFFDVPRYVDTYVEKSEKSDYVRVQHSYDQHICDADAAYAILAAIS